MRLSAAEVSVVIPTRGDVDEYLESILAPYDEFGFADGYIWNNGDGAHEDLGVYGRYAAIANTEAPVILTQDDDVILPPSTIESLLYAYDPGVVVCNIPERFRRRYTDSGMVGFGAIFDRDLPEAAFALFAEKPFKRTDTPGEFFYLYGDDQRVSKTFLQTSDLVFTMLTPMIKLDLPYTELAYGRDETRMWRQPGHFEERDTMRKLCREIRDG